MSSSGPPPRDRPRSSERDVLERAAHDLKNPLAVVRASLEWLEVELADREDALDAVRDARAAAERLIAIADDLDSLARLGGEGVADGDVVPIAPLVNAVVEAANAGLERRGITVEAIGRGAASRCDISSLRSTNGGPLEIPGDARLLGRSLTALVDATARGAPTGACIEITVAPVVSGSGDRAIEIGVALRGAVDTGATSPTVDASAGLGAYLALRVVEAHGGSLQVVPTTSLPRVVIRLPC